MRVDAEAIARGAADNLLSGSLQGAVVIALVWLLSRRIPRAPASVQAALWWLAALKLVVTLLPVPTLSIPLLPPETAVESANLESSRITARVSPSAPASATLPTTVSAVAAPGIPAWLVALVIAWFVGLAALAVRLVMALGTLGGVLRRSMPAPAADTALVAELADVIGLSRVPEVRVSSEIDSPQLVGVRRPVVLMPADASSALTPPEKAMALGHELMHVRRYDLALGWVPALAGHLFFFHPLARLAAREYLTAREAACDAAVVRALAISPKDYGRLLVRVGVAEPGSAFAAGGASPSLSSLKRRLEMLQHVGPTGLSRRAMWSVATVMVAAIVPFQLVARTPAEQAAPSSRAAAPARSSQPPRAVAERSAEEAIARAREAAAAAEDTLEEHRKALDVLSRSLAVREEAMHRALQQRSPDDRAVRAQAEAMEELVAARHREVMAAELAERELGDSLARAQALREDLEEQVGRQRQQELEAVGRRQEQELETLSRQRQALEADRLQQQQVHGLVAADRLRVAALEAIRRQQSKEQEAVSRERALEMEALAAARRQLAARSQGPPDTFSRGDTVVLAPADDGTRPPNSRVLAVAGDRIQVSRAGIIVNGVAVTGLSPDFLAGLPEDTWDQTIPARHYFVAAEQRSDSGVTRFWGMIPAGRIAGRR